MKKLIILCLAVLFLFTACGGRPMPEGVPDDFAVYYADWINENQPDIFDTYEGYIQKDLIMNGTAKTEYTPSDEVITAIYNKIVELELWKLPENMRAKTQVIQPMGYMEIRYTIDGRMYELLTNSSIFHGYGENIAPDDAEKAEQFCMFMQKTIMETEEYKSLPDSEGGYQ